jgi:thiamine biosynthesis lipoprotein
MERFVTINGKEYGHIIDPLTGRPVSDRISVTVITKTGVESDALSTAIFVKGYSFASKFPHVKTLVLQRNTKGPVLLDAKQTGDCWTLNLPVSTKTK